MSQSFTQKSTSNPRGLLILICISLLLFEIFNFSTTQYALLDVLGDLNFFGLRWVTILTLAFCGIDLAGLAKLFTPENRKYGEPAETWYLFGAWVLAAAMNATLTWWAVSLALQSHGTDYSTDVIRLVPVVVAFLVWLIRILIIGTLSIAGAHLFHTNSHPDNRRTTPIPPPRGSFHN